MNVISGKIITPVVIGPITVSPRTMGPTDGKAVLYNLMDSESYLLQDSDGYQLIAK